MKPRYIDQFGIDSLPNLIEASKNKCDMFVTINQGMIQDRKELEKKFKIKIVDPKEALKEMKKK